MRLDLAAPAALSSETERLCWTAAIVIGATVPHWATLPAWVIALLGVAIAWRLAIAVLAWPVPIRALRLAIVFVAFGAVLLRYRTINGVEAGSALLVVMIALKFLESAGHRDQLVLIMISYFLLFAGLLTERGPVMGAYLLVLTWITTVGLLQLSRRGPLLGKRATGALAGRLLLQSLPLMVVLFVLFPRLPGPLWAMPNTSTSGTTGLSDTMSPGDITSLALTDEVAFRVQFLSPPPPARELYWRGPTMVGFNGRTWSSDVGERHWDRPATSTVEYYGDPTEYRVMLEPQDRNWAFALEMPKSWSGERSLRMGSDYQLRTFSTPHTRLDYRVTSYTTYSAREPLTPRELDLFRRLPPDSSPRTRELVRSWLTDDPPPERVVERAMDYLRSQPFFYTLTPPALGAQPVDQFLFETREGFCEHYASAFTVMMRAAGLPARVVTGYQGGELNGVGGYYIVRQSDSHAWTEVWLADRGWIRVDPVSAVSPERVALGTWRSALAGERQPGNALGRIAWVRRMLLVLDAGATYWNDWVIGYGPDLQRALLDELGLGGAGRGERWTRLFLLSLGTLMTASLVLTLTLGWRRRRHGSVDPAARAFAAFSRRLEGAAVPARSAVETATAYGARAQAALPRSAGEIGAIVAAYLRARYEPDSGHASLAELTSLVRGFRPART